MSDRGFAIAFGVSLALHLGLLITQVGSFNWFKIPKAVSPLEVIYQYEVAKQELAELQAELAHAKRRIPAAPSPAASDARVQITIPDRPAVVSLNPVPTLSMGRSSIVDLTNLVSAAQGNPVLLSYFSVIREQIQQTANSHTWVTSHTQEGLVYVSFLLTSTGAIEDVAIVPDRSVPHAALHEIAGRIVRAAAPFPPFPPSIQEPSKTIIVPLEFSSEG